MQDNKATVAAPFIVLSGYEITMAVSWRQQIPNATFTSGYVSSEETTDRHTVADNLVFGGCPTEPYRKVKKRSSDCILLRVGSGFG